MGHKIMIQIRKKKPTIDLSWWHSDSAPSKEFLKANKAKHLMFECTCNANSFDQCLFLSAAYFVIHVGEKWHDTALGIKRLKSLIKRYE